LSKYARIFGSGSAPRTMAPGWPQEVQQTILAFGVLRGMTVMLGVGFGYPCSTYVPCLFAFRASADEETEMPRAQTSNPTMTDVLLLLAMTMEFLHRIPIRAGKLGCLLPAKLAEPCSMGNPGLVKIFREGLAASAHMMGRPQDPRASLGLPKAALIRR